MLLLARALVPALQHAGLPDSKIAIKFKDEVVVARITAEVVACSIHVVASSGYRQTV